MKQYTLEDRMMACWNVVEDIDSLYSYVMESEKLDRDFISNYLLGLSTIYELKHQECFAEFENCLKKKLI